MSAADGGCSRLVALGLSGVPNKGEPSRRRRRDGRRESR